MIDESDGPEKRLEEVVRHLSEKLATNARVFRAYHGLTQKEVAERGGLHRSQVGEIERGEGNPKLTTVTRLATAFNLDVHQLLFDINLPPLEGEADE